MIYGRFRDGFPRVTLEVPLAHSASHAVEFLVDSGFEGDLTMPPGLVMSLDAEYVGEFPYALADLTFRSRPVYQIVVDWMGEERAVSVVAMDGNPLLGIGLLRGNLVQIEMDDGGEVAVEPL